jgi:hypothetical protein
MLVVVYTTVCTMKNSCVRSVVPSMKSIRSPYEEAFVLRIFFGIHTHTIRPSDTAGEKNKKASRRFSKVLFCYLTYCVFL